MAFDVIFREATLFDGTGAPGVVGDLAVEGDRIAEVGAAPGSAAEVVDARGQAIAPGFIDVHTHDDFAALVYPDMAFKTLGGVTTCVVGNCGMGAAPQPAAKAMAGAMHPGVSWPEWDGYRGYLALLEATPPAANIAVLVGHGTARLAAMGTEARAPSPAEMAAIKATLAEGLEAGAVGLSSGLIYEPGKHAAAEELIELASLMAGTGALYATHMRDEGLGLLQSVDEAIRIGEAAGVPVQISHHKASGQEAWGLVERSLEKIEAAQQRGLEVHADQYPYTAGSTVLAAVVEGGRLAGAGGGIGALTPDKVVVASTARHRDWEGKSLEALAREFGADLEATIGRVLAEEPGTTVILHTMSEADVRRVMAHPSTMIGSDGLPTLQGKPHPRLYGTFARVLGRYARDEAVLDLADAVFKMTGMPAAKFGLAGRGRLERGAFADLCLFDPKTIVDRGTFEDPKQTPAGIAMVLVNGKAVVRDSAATAERPGRPLRRAGSQ
ncbi:MAG TPA: D-aminoacylase [Caulobacteraceae bacterium]|nr:D-aminoacylase [Caulobacteraceae bacterium]